jgi:hypothetical protein
VQLDEAAAGGTQTKTCLQTKRWRWEAERLVVLDQRLRHLTRRKSYQYLRMVFSTRFAALTHQHRADAVQAVRHLARMQRDVRHKEGADYLPARAALRSCNGLAHQSFARHP